MALNQTASLRMFHFGSNQSLRRRHRDRASSFRVHLQLSCFVPGGEDLPDYGSSAKKLPNKLIRAFCSAPQHPAPSAELSMVGGVFQDGPKEEWHACNVITCFRKKKKSRAWSTDALVLIWLVWISFYAFIRLFKKTENHKILYISQIF